MLDAGNFQILDYTTLFFFIIISVIPGLFHMVKAKNITTTHEFLISSQGINVFLVILSFGATTISTLAILTYPSDVYRNGAIYFVYIISMFLGVCFIAQHYVPVFFDNKVGSIFEYIERRFNLHTRLVFSGVQVIQDILTFALHLYAPALVINYVMNVDIWTVISILSLITIIYTALGGFLTVIWTDAGQYIVMILVIILILVKGFMGFDGIQEVWKINEQGNRTQILIFEQGTNSAYTIWMVLIGSPFYWSTQMIQQTCMQRCLAADSRFKAKMTMIGGGLAVLIVSMPLLVIGLLIYAKYHECDPLKSGSISSHDQLMAKFALETLQSIPGVVGLFIAGVLCASLSTLSSGINSSTTIIMEDFVRHFFPKLTERQLLLASKIIAIIYGTISTLSLIIIQKVNGLQKMLWIGKGVFGGGAIGMFTIGMISPWTSTKAAFVGFFAGTGFLTWVSIGNFLMNPHVPTAPISVSGCNKSTNMSIFANSTWMFNTTKAINQDFVYTEPFVLYTYNPLWYSCWSILIIVTVGLLATICIGPKDPEMTNPKLIFPFVINILNRLPDKTKRRLGFDPERSLYFLNKEKNREDKVDKQPLHQSPDIPFIEQVGIVVT